MQFSRRNALGRCLPLPVPLLASQSSSFPGTHLLLCFLFWSCLNCVIFVGECELFNPGGSARNTNNPANWHSPAELVADLHGALRLTENSGSGLSQASKKHSEKGERMTRKRLQSVIGRCSNSGACWIFVVNLYPSCF